MTANTAFQPRVWNNRNNDTQNIAGRYYSGVRAADCSSGWLCQRGEIDENGVSRMTAAGAGTDPAYACNPSDVRRLTAPDGNVYAVGRSTLGLGIPAGVTDTFTELIPGEIYSFGEGNFLDPPESGQTWFKMSGGQLTVSASQPAEGIYFELCSNLGSEVFTEGCWGTVPQYTVICRRA